MFEIINLVLCMLSCFIGNIQINFLYLYNNETANYEL